MDMDPVKKRLIREVSRGTEMSPHTVRRILSGEPGYAEHTLVVARWLYANGYRARKMDSGQEELARLVYALATQGMKAIKKEEDSDGGV